MNVYGVRVRLGLAYAEEANVPENEARCLQVVAEACGTDKLRLELPQRQRVVASSEVDVVRARSRAVLWRAAAKLKPAFRASGMERAEARAEGVEVARAPAVLTRWDGPPIAYTKVRREPLDRDREHMLIGWDLDMQESLHLGMALERTGICGWHSDNRMQGLEWYDALPVLSRIEIVHDGTMAQQEVGTGQAERAVNLRAKLVRRATEGTVEAPIGFALRGREGEMDWTVQTLEDLTCTLDAANPAGAEEIAQRLSADYDPEEESEDPTPLETFTREAHAIAMKWTGASEEARVRYQVAELVEEGLDGQRPPGVRSRGFTVVVPPWGRALVQLWMDGRRGNNWSRGEKGYRESQILAAKLRANGEALVEAVNGIGGTAWTEHAPNIVGRTVRLKGPGDGSLRMVVEKDDGLVPSALRMEAPPGTGDALDRIGAVAAGPLGQWWIRHWASIDSLDPRLAEADLLSLPICDAVMQIRDWPEDQGEAWEATVRAYRLEAEERALIEAAQGPACRRGKPA